MRSFVKLLLSLNCLLFAASAHAQSVQEYAKQCADAIGGEIPAFSCEKGTLIPIQGYVDDNNCENPAHLNGVTQPCRRDSRFQKLNPINIRPGFNAGDIEIRLLCRQYDDPQGQQNTNFDDIAIIQTNIKNGASCFFQSPTRASLPGNNIVSPSQPGHSLLGPGAGGCVGCHAARPFIETPFLKSVPGDAKIRSIFDFPRDKYWFPADLDRGVTIYRSTLPGNTSCTNCHNIGSASEGGISGYHNLALQSTGAAQHNNRIIPFMRQFLNADDMRRDPAGTINAHKRCFETPAGSRNPSECIVEDITTKARQDWERTRQPTGNNCNANQWWSQAYGRCFEKNGSCSQYNNTDDPTCQGPNDNLACDWDNSRRVCFDEKQNCSNDQWLPTNWGRCFNKKGDCNQYNGTDENTCTSPNDSLACDWVKEDFRCIAEPTNNNPGKIDTNKTFTLVASHSNKCLDAKNGGKNNGTTFQQWDCNGSNAQKFKFTHVSGDEYKFVNPDSNRCVSSAAGATNNGNKMVLWDCGNGSDQKVRLVPSKNGSYTVRFSNSNKCMDVQDFSSDNGKEIHQWDCSGGADQDWFLRDAK